MNINLLKRKILQLAFSGQLTSQKINVSDIECIYKKCIESKEQLRICLNAKKDKPYNNVSEEEIIYKIPESWKWIRLGETGIFKKGPFGSALKKEIFVPKSDTTIKVYEQQNAINKDITLGRYYITEEYFNENMKSFEVFPGDIIVSCAGTIGETYIVPEIMEKGIINQALMKMSIINEIDKEFFLYYFDFILKEISNDKSNGSAMKNIPPFDIFKNMLFPLTSIEEQREIVKKIHELFKLLDELEDRYDKLSKKKEFLKKKIIYELINNFDKTDLEEVPLGEILIYEQPTKYIVENTDYNSKYNIPVLTPGKTFILGYTNEKDGIFSKEKLPIIIFDDFTTESKYVDFEFKVKSSAIKILHCKKGNYPKYLFYLLQTLDINSETHKRYWISVFQNIGILLPDYKKQVELADKIDITIKLLNEL